MLIYLSLLVEIDIQNPNIKIKKVYEYKRIYQIVFYLFARPLLNYGQVFFSVILEIYIINIKSF